MSSRRAQFLFRLLAQGIVVPVLAVLCAILGLLLAEARRQARVLTARVSTLETRLAPGTPSSQPAAPPPAVAHGDAPAPVGIVILLFVILFFDSFFPADEPVLTVAREILAYSLSRGILFWALVVAAVVLGLSLAEARRRAGLLTARVGALETTLALETSSSAPPRRRRKGNGGRVVPVRAAVASCLAGVGPCRALVPLRRQHARAHRRRHSLLRLRLLPGLRGRPGLVPGRSPPECRRRGRHRVAGDWMARAGPAPGVRPRAAGLRRRHRLSDRLCCRQLRRGPRRARVGRHARAGRGDRHPGRGTGRVEPGGSVLARRVPRSGPGDPRRQPRRALLLLCRSRRRYRGDGLVQGMARVEPAGIRVHFPRRRLVGRRVLSASALRDDATVPGAVLRALRRGSGAARVASAGASRRVRRRDSRLRGAARGLYPAASAGKRIRGTVPR